VRIYGGRIVRGELSGARIVLKAYPPPALAAAIAASDSDAALDVAALADNEMRAHLRLQVHPPPAPSGCIKEWKCQTVCRALLWLWYRSETPSAP